MSGELKNEFEHIAKYHIKREGIDELLTVLGKTDFYTAPASTRHHHSYEGGLAEHSMEVLDYLLEEKEKSPQSPVGQASYETLAIIGLFHDLCKVGFYEVSTRNTKDEKGKWIQVPYYTYNDQLPLGHGEKSIIMLLEHIKLTTEEMMAIRWHMGGYEAKENYSTLSRAYTDYPLAMYIHFADMKSTYLSDREKA